MRSHVFKKQQNAQWQLVLTLIAVSLAAGFSRPREALADAPWTPPSHSYTIQASTPQGIAQKSGSAAKITGTISLVGELPWMLEIGDAHNQCNGSSKGPGCQEQALLNQLASDGLSLQAFFPDTTTNVTSQLSLSGNESQIQFTLNTPNLKSTDLNTLTLQLIHTNPNLQALQVVQAKLQVRIAALSSLLSQLTSQGKYSTADLQFLTSILNCLNMVSARITQQIQASTSVIAQIVYPLQVDNVVAQPGLNSSVLGHFRVAISSPVGSAIQGESYPLTSTITHLGDWDDADDGYWTDWNWTDLPSNQYVVQYSWNGKTVSQSTPQKLPSDPPSLTRIRQGSFRPRAPISLKPSSTPTTGTIGRRFCRPDVP